MPVTAQIVTLGKVEQGRIDYTGRQLDWGIDGQGFFGVQLRDGEIAYTREGSFQLDADGIIVTSHGLSLAANLAVPSSVTEVSITPSGLVKGFDPQEPDRPILIGQLTISRFVNAAGLRPIGDGLLLATEAAGQNAQPVEEGNPGTGGLGVLRDRSLEFPSMEDVRSTPADAGWDATQRESLRNARYDLACVYARLSAGRDGPEAEARPVSAEEAARLRGCAVEHLRQAIALGYGDKGQVAADESLAPLHDDPQWRQILEEMK